MKVYSDGSCIDGKMGTAAVMFKNGEEQLILRKHIGDECQHMVYEVEVIGLTLAAELVARENFVEDAIIRADNQAAIHVLEQTKGTPGQHLVDRLEEKIEEIYNKHGHDILEIWWTPGHEGIMENKRADQETKKAAKGDTSPDDQLPSRCRDEIKTIQSVARQNHSKLTKSKAANQFKKLPRFPRLHEINPLTPSPRFRKDSGRLPRN